MTQHPNHPHLTLLKKGQVYFMCGSLKTSGTFAIWELFCIPKDHFISIISIFQAFSVFILTKSSKYSYMTVTSKADWLCLTLKKKKMKWKEAIHIHRSNKLEPGLFIHSSLNIYNKKAIHMCSSNDLSSTLWTNWSVHWYIHKPANASETGLSIHISSNIFQPCIIC